MRDINSMSRGNALAPNRRNSLPCRVRTSRQRSCHESVGCLLYSVVRFYEVGRGGFCASLVPCFGQDDYRAATPHRNIITYFFLEIRQFITDFLRLLHEPRLPLNNMNDVMSSVGARLPSDLQRIIAKALKNYEQGHYRYFNKL